MKYFKNTLLFLLPLVITSNLYADNGIEKKILIKSTKSWNGATLPNYSKGQPEITIARIKIQPGEKLPWHYHPFANAGVLISGELTVITKDGQKNVLKAGEAIIAVVDTLHYGFNSGNTIVDIIMVYAGIENKPVTILENKQ